MNTRSVIAKTLSAAAALAISFAVAAVAQQPSIQFVDTGPQAQQGAEADGPVTIISPSPWSTLRSDSLVVSVQADPAALPKGSIDFKVVRRSGTRASTVITKNVKMEEPSADIFLGRVRELPVGGTVFLSVEWSVPGSDLKGVVEPVGIVRLAGEVSADKKWVPSQQPLTAVKLGDGLSGAQVEEALAGSAGGFEVGGISFAAGWSSAGLFIRFAPADGAADGVDFAFDLKCGKSAFLAWADRFVVYSTVGDSLSGRHYGKRSVDKDGLKLEELAWGGKGSPGLEKMGGARVVTVRWPDLGMQPFEERTLGFAIFANGRAKRSYPASADRLVPGTWGEIKLAK